MQNTLLLCIFLYHCILYFQNVAFLALFLFQRFVESTFFCRMYKYIIFVIVILIILQLSLFTFFHLQVFLKKISISVVPSPVRCKLNFKFCFMLWIKFLELRAYPSSGKQRCAHNITKLSSSRLHTQSFFYLFLINHRIHEHDF